jgi:hypothetical protein
VGSSEAIFGELAAVKAGYKLGQVLKTKSVSIIDLKQTLLGIPKRRDSRHYHRHQSKNNTAAICATEPVFGLTGVRGRPQRP